MTDSITSRASATSRGRPALPALVAVPEDVFAGRYWGLEPLISRSADLPGELGDLFDVAAVDELVSRRGLRAPFLRVAKDGRTYGDREFTAGGGVGAAIADQVSDDKLLRLFADGATLVLQGLHRTWPALIDFTQRLSGELGHPVQTNAYITPSQNTGFDDHYDVHDVFVVQVAGEKRWRIRPPVHRWPLRDEPWTAHRDAVRTAAAEPPMLELTLQPGDCLYLPRGYLHSATALGGVSTHLTIGVHVWTRRHLADELATLALTRASRDPALRVSLPAYADVTRGGELRDDVDLARAALVRALESLDADDVAAALGRRVRDAQRPEPVSPVAQTEAAAALSPDATLRLREHLVARIEEAPDGSALVRSRAGDLRLAAADVPAVRRLLDHGSAGVADLGLDLARRLLLTGLALPGDPA
ncbi:cupin domain-containing protein [Luteipulveratus sp. YIM 133132]|uniref:cupin domain-containing protein n=1 Tax=Luteipulveratus flavus TaxID=3031728 RepID=UPI0023AEC642|nr:cupin domain-containing protein [Luteipulveratus sp. YIM 133132]MDE9364700.1 cupin domain-containing protein [Luteipulveratus sp. YIM 133132]